MVFFFSFDDEILISTAAVRSSFWGKQKLEYKDRFSLDWEPLNCKAGELVKFLKKGVQRFRDSEAATKNVVLRSSKDF